MPTLNITLGLPCGAASTQNHTLNLETRTLQFADLEIMFPCASSQIWIGVHMWSLRINEAADRFTKAIRTLRTSRARQGAGDRFTKAVST